MNHPAYPPGGPRIRFPFRTNISALALVRGPGAEKFNTQHRVSTSPVGTHFSGFVASDRLIQAALGS